MKLKPSANNKLNNTCTRMCTCCSNCMQEELVC